MASAFAKRILNQVREAYVPEHDFRVTDLKEFPRLNHRFYQQTGNALEREGFSLTGDLEDWTLKQVSPDPKTVIRSYLDATNTISAAIYHVKPNLLWQILMFISGMGFGRIFEMETEFPTGFVITTKAPLPQNPDLPDCIYRFKMSKQATVEEMLELHKEKVEWAKREIFKTDPVKIHDLDGVIASQNRQFRILHDHLEAIGWVSKSRLMILGASESNAEDLKREIEQILESEKNA